MAAGKTQNLKLNKTQLKPRKAFPWNADMANMIGEQVGIPGMVNSPVSKNRQPEPGKLSRHDF